MEEDTRGIEVGGWGLMAEEVNTVWHKPEGGPGPPKSVRLTIKGRINRPPKRLAPCL